jgi:hypothetical protein
MSFVGGKLNLKGVKIGAVKKKKKKKGEIAEDAFDEPEPVSPVVKEVPHIGKTKIIKVRKSWHALLGHERLPASMQALMNCGSCEVHCPAIME